MKISIVMTTYNGSKYLLEQLNSLKLQERPADEVIILDDYSTDNTVEIINEFIEKHHLSNWVVKRNKINVGWKKNFIHGFDLASGDLIFPCDQDDIWHIDKISVMAEIMEKNTDIALLVGEADYIFMNITNKKKSLLKRSRVALFIDIHSKNKKLLNSKKISQKFFDKEFKKVKQGCLMGVRRDFYESIKGYWISELPHDSFLSHYAKLNKRYYSLDYKVIDYRYHLGSASNPINNTRISRIKELEVDKKEIDNLIENNQFTSDNQNSLKILVKAKKWNTSRISLVKNRNVISGVYLISLLQFYPKYRRYLTDLMYALKGK